MVSTSFHMNIVLNVVFFLPDINECQTSNGGCNQSCINTVGSFQCFCDVGYTLASDNVGCDGKHQLSHENTEIMLNVFFPDINECQASNGRCSQTCTNTVGSFECSCDTGYTLASDNLGCNGKHQLSHECCLECCFFPQILMSVKPAMEDVTRDVLTLLALFNVSVT